MEFTWLLKWRSRRSSQHVQQEEGATAARHRVVPHRPCSSRLHPLLHSHCLPPCTCATPLSLLPSTALHLASISQPALSFERGDRGCGCGRAVWCGVGKGARCGVGWDLAQLILNQRPAHRHILRRWQTFWKALFPFTSCVASDR